MSTALVFRTVVAVGLLSAACSRDLDSAGTTPESSTTEEVTWKVLAESQDQNVYISVPAAASRGKDAAVAYVERIGDSSTATSVRVVMQRFDASGERLGSLAVLGNDSNEYSNVTLASDGKQYAGCWNAALEVHCSLVDEQGQVQPDALAIAGQFATIVAGASGWALAYSGSDGLVRLQLLTSSLALKGSALAPQLSAQFAVDGDSPLFVATPSGYVLVASSKEGGEVSLLRLSADLQSVVSASALGRDLWSTGQLVASDTRAAVSLAAPYGSFMLLVDETEVSAELPIAGGGKTGMDEALVLTEGGIGAAWLKGEGQVRRHYFADGHDAEIGLETRIPTSNLLSQQEQGTGSYQQLVKVGTQTLLVARSALYGYLASGGAIRVATLQFP